MCLSKHIEQNFSPHIGHAETTLSLRQAAHLDTFIPINYWRLGRKGNRGLDFMDWPVKRFIEKDARFVRHEDGILKHVESS